MYLIFHPCLLAHLVPCPELIFFFRVTLVTIAIMFHNPILILTLCLRTVLIILHLLHVILAGCFTPF